MPITSDWRSLICASIRFLRRWRSFRPHCGDSPPPAAGAPGLAAAHERFIVDFSDQRALLEALAPATSRAEREPMAWTDLIALDRLAAKETGLPVHIADDPLSAVAEGTGRVLQELAFLKRVASSRS